MRRGTCQPMHRETRSRFDSTRAPLNHRSFRQSHESTATWSRASDVAASTAVRCKAAPPWRRGAARQPRYPCADEHELQRRYHRLAPPIALPTCRHSAIDRSHRVGIGGTDGGRGATATATATTELVAARLRRSGGGLWGGVASCCVRCLVCVRVRGCRRTGRVGRGAAGEMKENDRRENDRRQSTKAGLKTTATECTEMQTYPAILVTGRRMLRGGRTSRLPRHERRRPFERGEGGTEPPKRWEGGLRFRGALHRRRAAGGTGFHAGVSERAAAA